MVTKNSIYHNCNLSNVENYGLPLLEGNSIIGEHRYVDSGRDVAEESLGAAQIEYKKKSWRFPASNSSM